jgi:hypothetical protein
VLRIIRHAFLAAVSVALVLLAAAFTAPRWLGTLLGVLLPAGWRLDELALAGAAPRLPVVERLALSKDGCRLLVLDDGRVTLRWTGLDPQLEAVKIAALSVDPVCLPATRGAGGSPMELPEWPGAVLGGARLVVDRLTVVGWLPEPHRVELAAAADALRVAGDGPILKLDGTWSPTTRQGAFEASVTQAGPVAGLGVRGTLQTGPDLAAGVDLSARLVGALPAIRSTLDGELVGRWTPDGVALGTLRLGLDHAAIPALTAERIRVELEEPARFDPASGQLSAVATIGAERLNLADAGRLDRPTATLRVAGDLASLEWRAEVRAAGGMGPVDGAGRWSATGLDGRFTLDGQALPALQVLLPPTLPVELEGGSAAADVTLAWPGAEGANVGLEGELRVTDGRLGGTHWAADRVAVRLPFRYAGGTLQLGGRRAAQVTVGTITAAVPAESLSARVGGTWPWSSGAPLRVEGLRLRLLGGEAALDTLRLPQRGRAVNLRLHGIRLEQVSGLHGEEVVSLGGAVDADLPLHLDHGSLLIEDGTVRNTTPVRLRLTDADAIAAFKTNNPTLAEAADWLSDLHVDHLDGTVNLKRDGALVLVATIEGRNPQRGDRPVRLNYRHEENLLHLLQSLRIGSDLSRGIEQRLSPQQRRR